MEQASNPDHVIRCARLTKVFKDFWLRDRVTAVNAIDLDVRRGEVFGLLGPNGSGKSTTIKMILGLLHPTSGVISVFGKSPRDVSTKQNIGYLPEDSYLYRFLNARETLEYYAKLFHQDRRQRQSRIDMLLEMVGLDKVQRRPVGEYSKGMQRRIGLAQALINDPQLLILDEPTTGLDPIGTRQIKDLIVKLKDAGKTVLLCSHLLADVEDVTDRAAIMFGGKVRRAGTIDELLAKHDQTTITAAAVEGVTVEELVSLLGSRGIHDVQVMQSRQKLESLFLDIVHQAQNEGISTAGAGNAGAVAAFLTAPGTSALESSDGPVGRSVAAVDAGAAAGGDGEGDEEVLDDLVAPVRLERPEPVDVADPQAGPGHARDVPRGPSALPADAELGDAAEPPMAGDADAEVLDELTGQAPAPAVPPPPKPATAEPVPPAERTKPVKDDDADQSLLDDLMRP